MAEEPKENAGMKLMVAQEELRQYLEAQYRINLRLRIANKLEDAKMKDDLMRDAERIEKSIDIINAEIEAARKQFTS
jgi:hypothetical protein